jgi:hypothetical protein
MVVVSNGCVLRYLVRGELRRRWKSVLLLAVLVAVVVAVVLASLAGARRTESSFDRYLAHYRSIDAAVLSEERPPDANAIQRVEGVDAAIGFDLAAMFPTPIDGSRFFPMVAVHDGRVPHDYMRAPIVRGRAPDLTQPLEVALSEQIARVLHVDAGGRLAMATYSPELAPAVLSDDGGDLEPDGPQIDLRVVGIARDPVDIAGREGDITLTFLTPAFLDRYRDQIGTIGGGALVALTSPDELPRFAEAVAPIAGGEVDSSFGAERLAAQLDPTLRALAYGLRAFAAVAAILGCVAVAQTIARTTATSAADDVTLDALGCTRTARLGRLAAPPLLAIVLGSLVGAAASVAASPIFPIGIARRAELAPGLDADPGVIGQGIVITFLVGAAITAVVAAFASRRLVIADESRASGVAATAARLGASPSIVGGLQLALNSGRGPRRTPVRSAASAAAVATAGVVAALVFGASLQHTITTPRLYGWGWDATLTGAEGSQLRDGSVETSSLVDDPAFSAVAEVVFDLEVTLDGKLDRAIAIGDLRGETRPIIVRGRGPVSVEEVALGAETLHDLKHRIGDTVEVSAGGAPRDLTIVGVAAFPVADDGGSSTTGALMTRGAADATGFGGSCDGEVSCYRNYAVTAAAGVDVAAATKRYVDPDRNVDVALPRPPGQVARLAAVRRLPWLLAAFLAAIAILAVSHAAATSVRRRQRDLAIFRTIGFTGRDLRTVVTVQVAVLTLSGCAIGVVAGAVLGRQVWRLVIDNVGLPYAPVIPVLLMLAVPIGTVVLAYAAASWPRRAAGRLDPAVVLRSE